jgi:hypothetical protein
MQACTLLFKLARVDLHRVVAACGTGWATGREPGTDLPLIMWFGAQLTPWNDLLQDAPPPLHPDYQFWGNSCRVGEVNINATRITEVDGTDVCSLTRAEMEGRRQIIHLVDFFRAHVPGLEDAYVTGTAPFTGIRETRRIMGEYILTGEDVLAGRRFDDAVARAAYPIDIHDALGRGTSFGHASRSDSAAAGNDGIVYIAGDGSYDIPYRCLVPIDVDDLLVAGRAISATHEAQAAVRVMVTSMAIGQAAGTAAALCCGSTVRPRRLDARALQRALLAQGVNLQKPQA